MMYVSYEVSQKAARKRSLWERLAVSMFEAIIPAANPDFEYLYEDVSVWWLELDENGIPVREIGFNLSGQPIVAAPLGENFGVFTDSAVPCNGFNLLNESQFNEQWRYFVRLWDEERK